MSAETGLGYVKSFRELGVYRKQRELSRELFRRSLAFPREERYSLTDQMRRAVRAIGAQIAEAWAKRLYPKHFISKLTDADGEQMETQHWLSEAADADYMKKEDAARLIAQCEEIGRMLGAMIRKSDSFASVTYSVREEADNLASDDATDYFPN